jgi:hypothetical protein
VILRLNGDDLDLASTPVEKSGGGRRRPTMNRSLCPVAIAAALFAFAAAPVQTPDAPAAQSKTEVPLGEGEKLRALFHESDGASLRRNPIRGIFRGDLRYADRFGDYCSGASPSLGTRRQPV